MPHKFYDSASGSGSAPYESVATAANNLAAALGAIGASDEIIWAKNTSSENLVANTTYTASAIYATPEKPQRLFSVFDFDASPGTLAAGAEIKTTGSFQLVFVGNWSLSGKKLNPYNSSTSSANPAVVFHGTAQSGVITADDCEIGSSGTGATQVLLQLGVATASTVLAYISRILNSRLFWGAAGQYIHLLMGRHSFHNVSIVGAVTPTTLFKAGTRAASDLVVTDSDLSGKNWTNFIDFSLVGAQCNALVENCKIPAGINWVAGVIQIGNSLTVINSGSADVGYGFAHYSYAGSILHDPSVYAASNPIATKSGVPYSVLMVSGANCGRGVPLKRRFPLPIGNNETKTPFVELLVMGDGAAARNNTDIYVNVRCITTDGTTLGTRTTSHPGPLAAGSALSAGTISYTGDGYTTERTHRIEMPPLTARQDCFVEVEVCLAKPSEGIYIGQVGLA
jgi:hypothetical protein